MQLTEIQERLESIESLLLAIVPWHKLNAAQKAKMGPLMERSAPEAVGDLEERKKFVKREFLKLINLLPAKRLKAKFPRALIPQDENHKIPPCVPLSILANRCRARKVFAPVTGEDSAAQNVLVAIRECGLVTATLEQLGLLRFSDVPVVLTSSDRTRINPVIFPEGEDDDEEQAPIRTPKKKKTKPSTWAGFAVEPEETFEESSAAQGIGTIPNRDEDLTDTTDIVEDDEAIEDDTITDEQVKDVVAKTMERTRAIRARIEAELDEEDLTTTTDDVDDDDWGPDEIEFNNPVRQEFEEAAERQAREDAEKLASGKYYLRNGIVTAKK